LATTRISIVIPTYARPERLRGCLRGIESLDFPRDQFEVIVVDDGGREPAAGVVAEFANRFPIRLITQARGGPASARNAGAAVAGGRFIAFVDDDCVPMSGWLTALARELERHSDRLLAGPVVNALPDNSFSAATQLICTFVAEYYATGRGRERFFTTNNLALSAARFRELGGFDPSIRGATAEDKDFCDRWQARGYELGWVPGATVHHLHELNLWSFIRQHYNYGRGILSFRLKRRRRAASRIVPEAPSFYGKLILHPLRSGGQRRWRMVFLLILSQLALAVGAANAALADRAWRQRGPRPLPAQQRGASP
jgi:GT2 family glycosyltransferase